MNEFFFAIYSKNSLYQSRSFSIGRKNNTQKSKRKQAHKKQGNQHLAQCNVSILPILIEHI